MTVTVWTSAAEPGYWRLVEKTSYAAAYGAGHNIQETAEIRSDGGTFRQTTSGYGALEGATVEIRFTPPPEVLVPGKPFPTAASGEVTWSEVHKASIGFAKSIQSLFDLVDGEQNVWPLPGDYVRIARVTAGVNGANLDAFACFDSSGSQEKLVPSGRKGSRRMLRYLATDGGNYGWGFVYQWNTGVTPAQGWQWSSNLSRSDSHKPPGGPGQAVPGLRFTPVCNFFPNSVFDSTFTRPFTAANGTASLVAGNGGQKEWLLEFHGLSAGVKYEVYITPVEARQGVTETAKGPFRLLGTFVSGGTTSTFRCSAADNQGGSFYVNDATNGHAILVGVIPR